MKKSLKKSTLIIIPAYNAEKTISQTIRDVLKTGFHNIIVSDDHSLDDTYDKVKNEFPEVNIIYQDVNLGYGGNQKFLYNYALNKKFKYVIMIHGDYQYTPLLIPSMVTMMHYAGYDFVFGSRILGGNAIKGGMPVVRYVSNRVLTLFQNIFTGYKLSEYHSGLRGYKLEVLNEIKYDNFSRNFIFDNQIILGFISLNKLIGEVSCVTRYDTNSSSINYKESTIYGFQVVYLTLIYTFRKIFR